jgi:uncharacterized membrane protein
VHRRWFGKASWLLIFASVIVQSIFRHGQSDATARLLHNAEMVLVFIFAAEVVLRVAAAGGHQTTVQNQRHGLSSGLKCATQQEQRTIIVDAIWRRVICLSVGAGVAGYFSKSMELFDFAVVVVSVVGITTGRFLSLSMLRTCR